MVLIRGLILSTYKNRCNVCKRVYFNIKVYPIHCSCGNKIGKSKAKITPFKKPKPKKPIVNREITIEDGSRIDHFPTIASPFVTIEDLSRDAVHLANKIRHLNIKEIVGVPRSGMIAASIIATQLGVHLSSLDEKKIVSLDSGSRFRDKVRKKDGITLVVDDSSATGRQINEIKEALNGDVKFATVYTTKRSSSILDYYHKILPLPHWFEWNLMGNDLLINHFNISTDMDGILCEDCPVDMDDDGDRYLEWMKNVRPLHLPSTKLNYIITARLEKYRPQTKEWLDRYNIKYKELIMGPWSSQNERNNHCIGSWKADKILENKVILFFESDWHQSQIISRYKSWGGGVICPSRKVCIHRGDGPDWEKGLAEQWYI